MNLNIRCIEIAIKELRRGGATLMNLNIRCIEMQDDKGSKEIQD